MGQKIMAESKLIKHALEYLSNFNHNS